MRFTKYAFRDERGIVAAYIIERGKWVQIIGRVRRITFNGIDL